MQFPKLKKKITDVWSTCWGTSAALSANCMPAKLVNTRWVYTGKVTERLVEPGPVSYICTVQACRATMTTLWKAITRHGHNEIIKSVESIVKHLATRAKWPELNRRALCRTPQAESNLKQFENLTVSSYDSIILELLENKCVKIIYLQCDNFKYNFGYSTAK